MGFGGNISIHAYNRVSRPVLFLEQNYVLRYLLCRIQAGANERNGLTPIQQPLGALTQPKSIS